MAEKLGKYITSVNKLAPLETVAKYILAEILLLAINRNIDLLYK